MASPETTTGSCLCGAIRFSLRLPTLFCGHCHCTMCQRNHGAGYVTWIGIQRDQLSIDQGESTLTRYESSDHGSRSFCSRCGSSLFCESTHHVDRVDIPLANLHGPIDKFPQLHVYFDDRALWVHAEDGLPRLGGESGMEPLNDDE